MKHSSGIYLSVCVPLIEFRTCVWWADDKKKKKKKKKAQEVIDGLIDSTDAVPVANVHRLIARALFCLFFFLFKQLIKKCTFCVSECLGGGLIKIGLCIWWKVHWLTGYIGLTS